VLVPGEALGCFAGERRERRLAPHWVSSLPEGDEGRRECPPRPVLGAFRACVRSTPPKARAVREQGGSPHISATGLVPT
jgi:hypothetical protein